jgi:hypothetical protein
MTTLARRQNGVTGTQHPDGRLCQSPNPSSGAIGAVVTVWIGSLYGCHDALVVRSEPAQPMATSRSCTTSARILPVDFSTQSASLFVEASLLIDAGWAHRALGPELERPRAATAAVVNAGQQGCDRH